MYFYVYLLINQTTNILKLNLQSGGLRIYMALLYIFIIIFWGYILLCGPPYKSNYR